MKNAIGIFVCMFIVGCASVPSGPPGPPGPPVGPYQKVLEVQGTKDEIFVKTMRWMTKTFQSAKSVIQYQDKEAGIVTGNGKVDMNNPVATMYLDFVLTVEIKDGKVRLSFDNLTTTMIIVGRDTRTRPIVEGPGVEAEIHKRLDPLVESYQREMSTTSDF